MNAPRVVGATATTKALGRISIVKCLGRPEPDLLLLYGGEFLSGALRNVRVTEDEVRATVRSAGLTNLEAVEAVIPETDGSFSVVHPARNGICLQPGQRTGAGKQQKRVGTAR